MSDHQDEEPSGNVRLLDSSIVVEKDGKVTVISTRWPDWAKVRLENEALCARITGNSGGN